MSRPGNLWRRVHGSIRRRPTNFSWVLPGRLAGCGLPTTQPEFEWLVGRGIECVVTMTEEPLPPQWTSHVSYKHTPTPDMTAPEVERLDETVDFVHENIGAGRPTMVHCAAGLGRAGTVLACYLVKYQNCGAQQAIDRIRALRPGSVQSDVQEMAVAMYERHLR